MTHSFCSVQSRARTEPLYGTVARVHTWLLLEYPGIWRPDAIEGSTLPGSTKERLAQIESTEPLHRQLFIRQTHRRRETMRCFVIRSTETDPTIKRIEVPTCDGPPTESLAAFANHASAKLLDQPMFLVCTHGNHDKCCAKFGLPVYYALRDVAAREAWQCSHVGGDRFAGNLLCFPHGIYYGHVTPADVAGLVDSYRKGQLSLKHYRGRSCYSKGVQAAEYFVRSETGILGLDDLRLENARRGDEWIVRFRGPNESYEVTLLAKEGASAYLTCKAERPQPASQYELQGFRVCES